MRAGTALSQFMRRKQVAFELNISRHTLARLIERDSSFPRFFKITPGVEVIGRSDFDRWLKEKRLASLQSVDTDCANDRQTRPALPLAARCQSAV